MAGKVENKNYYLLWWSDKQHFPHKSYNCLGLSDEDNSVSRSDNFVNVNVFNSVKSPRVLSYSCVLHYFSTMPVGFNFNLTFGLKPQVGGIKIVTVYKRSIFQVEWLVTTLIAIYIINQYRLYVIIVNRGDWLGSPANIKGTNKDAEIYVERSTTLHKLLFSPHTLCMNYVTNTFLLVSSSVWSKQLLCFVQGQGQKKEQ